jgi:acetyltransferase
MPADLQDDGGDVGDVELADGMVVRLRPVHSKDKAPLQDLVERMSSEDVRMRFHEYKDTLSDSLADDFTDVDDKRGKVFVVTEPLSPGDAEIFGVVQVMTDPQGEQGEYAVMVRTDMQGLGMGRRLMERIIEYSRDRGIKEIVGDVLRENGQMLRLCDKLGFAKRTSFNDPALIEVRLKL